MNLAHIYIYIYIYIYKNGEILDFGKYDKMIKTSRKWIIQTLTMGFSCDISFFIQENSLMKFFLE